MRVLIVGIAIASGMLWADWPVPQSAADAYGFIQKKRPEAEKLWSKGDPQGRAALQDLLRYLEQPILRDLASGSMDLASRKINLLLDLASAYAIAGDAENSVKTLQQIADIRPDPGFAGMLERMNTFAPLRERQDFQNVLRTFRAYEYFWDSKELATPFQSNLSDSEKIAGLSKFWSEVKYNFGFPEKLLALNWDKLYLEALPKVLATKSTLEYYQELAVLCARLSDGHTNVYPPPEIDAFSKPPLRTRLIEGRVMILDVASPALAKQGVSRGSEIIAVDGQPVLKYAEEFVAPYQGGATPQDRELRTFWYGFLRGPKDRAVALKLRDASGKETTVSLARSGYTDVPARKVVEWKELPGNIGYVALNDFSSNQAVSQWKELLPKILATPGLILDVRLNGGGSSNIGYEILSTLVDKPFRTSRQVMRRYNPTHRAWGESMGFTEVPASTWQPSGSGYGTKPIVVLSGPATYSAAEDFLVAWKDSGRGKIVGEASGGSTGQPLFMKLPGGGTARICTKRDTFPDGREWVGKGIEPDVVARPTVASVRADADPELEAAVKLLGVN